jgi:hypothetical protein
VHIWTQIPLETHMPHYHLQNTSFHSNWAVNKLVLYFEGPQTFSAHSFQLDQWNLSRFGLYNIFSPQSCLRTLPKFLHSSQHSASWLCCQSHRNQCLLGITHYVWAFRVNCGNEAIGVSSSLWGSSLVLIIGCCGLLGLKSMQETFVTLRIPSFAPKQDILYPRSYTFCAYIMF